MRKVVAFTALAFALPGCLTDDRDKTYDDGFYDGQIEGERLICDRLKAKLPHSLHGRYVPIECDQ